MRALFTLGVLALAVASCTPSAPRDPDVIVVAREVGPNNLDPWQAGDEGTARVAELVFDSLMDIGDDLSVTPTLAERLENPDPLTYIVHLRRGVPFHDGHELTARDVVYTYERVLDPGFLSYAKGAFGVLEAVRALDDYTVEFRLKEPFAAFPIQLVSPPVVPAGKGGEMSSRPIGTGPYRFVRHLPDDRVELAAFEDYWDGAPRNAGIVIKIVPDATMRGLELRKGTADLLINDIPPDIVHQLEQRDDFTVVREPGLDFSYIGFNMNDPVVADRRVRHAIGYAIDRDAIVRYLRRDLARPAVGLIPPEAWAFEPDVHRFTYDPARAMQLLDEAGYPDPDGDGPLPRLSLTLSLSTTEDVRLEATVMQQDLRRVGIDLVLRSYEFATFYADVLKGNFQMFTLRWAGGALVDPDMLRRVFHSQQTPPVGFNRGGYSNPEVDRLIDAASAATDLEERRALFARVQQIIAEDAPYIPIWNRTNVMVAQPDLTGLRINAVGSFSSLKDVRRVGG